MAIPTREDYSPSKNPVLRSGQFYGCSASKWSGNGLHIAISDFRQNLAVPNHQHANAYVCFVIDGLCRERETGREWSLDKGSVTLYEPGSEHSDVWPQSGKCLLIEVAPDYWKRFAEFGTLPARVEARSECSDIASKIFHEFSIGKPLSYLACEGLVVWLAAKMLQPTIHDLAAPVWLRTVRDRLAAQVGQHFSLLELATDAGVHPAHLAASFRKHYGQSVGDFVATRRLNEAARLLTGSDTPVGEIATMLGYADQSHFCRAFKSRFTLAPSRYRQSGH